MSTSPVMTVTDELLAELEAAADVFPDYEWDSNTEPFFNGPSGESLGGGSTGFYCVYGQPFEIDDETYDGPTLVEACPLEQAKFICEAKPTIKMFTAELRRLRAENAELERVVKDVRWRVADTTDQLQAYGFNGERLYGLDEWSVPIRNLSIAIGMLEKASK